ncbi:hypothetical protein SAMN05421810_102185 [Amycolatopsis arida]|uniref:Uncharacterized protein n=1 Tax=Amycolatopsis arida TaxID=587909 RepID=A0A1I5P8C1_9PSEU|nr:hypothetical protein CLV69_101185 [Amycolatopsis arida]SFP30050.1 hypothetical protein SAMN05421810_102185 [Amycolatopsis arida]
MMESVVRRLLWSAWVALLTAMLVVTTLGAA